MITDRDLHWMDVALAEAAAAEARQEVPVGAVVVRDDRLLARAGNAQRTTADPTAHAEIRALRVATARVGNYRLPGATLYVTLEPCIMCIGACLAARVERLVFGCEDPKAGAAGTVLCVTDHPGLNHRVRVEAGARVDAAGALLKRFFAARR